MTNALQPHVIAEDYPFPLILIDTDSLEISWANQAAQAFIGQSMRHLVERSLWDVLQIADDVKARLQNAAKSGSGLTVHDCNISCFGKPSTICDLTAYHTEAGVCLSLRASRPTDPHEGMDVASGLGRMIAHELKNPLAGIKGAAQLLQPDVISAEGKSLLELISSEIDRIRRLADRMETLGDPDPQNYGPVNIHALLQTARQVIQSANPNLIFREQYDPSLPSAMGDADSLLQALLNLIKNASEAIDKAVENPEIILETRYRSGVSSTAKKRGRYLPIAIHIIDNGGGIDPSIRDQLFQPFVTDKADGQGLGLALVSKVISAHGGLIEVDSQPGRTEFKLLLPVPTSPPIGDAI